MKVYCIHGVEGSAGYLKQSMKLPKSWASKPLTDVLALFVTTYNKKFAESPISAEAYHLERPLGSTLFPDDHVASALSDYCDVYVVEGAVRYKGPPPGTAAAQELVEAAAREAEERAAAARSAEEDAQLAAAGILKDQWQIKVKCVGLDRGGMDVKSTYSVGDTVKVTIEPHATVGMLHGRIALLCGAHEKHQSLRHPRSPDVSLDPTAKLKEVTNEKVVLQLVVSVPSTVRVVEAVSDDEGATGAEAEAPPEPPAAGECADWEKQSAHVAEGASLRASGDAAGAVGAYSAALALGGASAALVCKRADALLGAGRPAAAAADATAALGLNPDSAKGYKLRGKARRVLGEYEDAAADFGTAQRIDFDDGILADLSYVANRAKKIRAKALAEAHNAKLAADAADAPAEEAN